MPEFVRIKDYVINLETLTYIRVGDDYMDFAFAYPTKELGGQNHVRLERGVDLQDIEFEELKRFAFGLPKSDRVLVV